MGRSSRHRTKPKASSSASSASASASSASASAALLVLSLALVALFSSDVPLLSSFLPSSHDAAERPVLRRSLLQEGGGTVDRTTGAAAKAPAGRNPPLVYRWARDHVLPLKPPAPEEGREEKETVLFWHIPKSGGSTAKSYYRCLGKAVDVESRPDDVKKAAAMGLVPSGQVDVVFSSYPDVAIANLFDPDHKARVLAMFRHPVDRLISKFYYLQVATWENTYRPEWKGMDVLEWVRKHNIDNDHMVKKLAGKVQRTKATEDDLVLAKRTIQQRFFVGLMTDMAETMRRFDVVMGISQDTDKRYAQCREQFFGKKEVVRNSHAHPKVEKGSPAWDLLAEQNAYDIRLYEYVLDLYAQQKLVVDAYDDGGGSAAVVDFATSAAARE